MHIENKQAAISKVFAMLNQNGIFALSTDKNQDNYIDTGMRKIRVYPDSKADIMTYMENAGFKIKEHYETEFANIFIAIK